MSVETVLAVFHLYISLVSNNYYFFVEEKENIP